MVAADAHEQGVYEAPHARLAGVYPGYHLHARTHLAPVALHQRCAEVWHQAVTTVLRLSQQRLQARMPCLHHKAASGTAQRLGAGCCA